MILLSWLLLAFVSCAAAAGDAVRLEHYANELDKRFNQLLQSVPDAFPPPVRLDLAKKTFANYFEQACSESIILYPGNLPRVLQDTLAELSVISGLDADQLDIDLKDFIFSHLNTRALTTMKTIRQPNHDLSDRMLKKITHEFVHIIAHYRNSLEKLGESTALMIFELIYRFAVTGEAYEIALDALLQEKLSSPSIKDRLASILETYMSETESRLPSLKSLFGINNIAFLQRWVEKSENIADESLKQHNLMLALMGALSLVSQPDIDAFIISLCQKVPIYEGEVLNALRCYVLRNETSSFVAALIPLVVNEHVIQSVSEDYKVVFTSLLTALMTINQELYQDALFALSLDTQTEIINWFLLYRDFSEVHDFIELGANARPRFDSMSHQQLEEYVESMRKLMTLHKAMKLINQEDVEAFIRTGDFYLRLIIDAFDSVPIGSYFTLFLAGVETVKMLSAHNIFTKETIESTTILIGEFADRVFDAIQDDEDLVCEAKMAAADITQFFEVLAIKGKLLVKKHWAQRLPEMYKLLQLENPFANLILAEIPVFPKIHAHLKVFEAMCRGLEVQLDDVFLAFVVSRLGSSNEAIPTWLLANELKSNAALSSTQIALLNSVFKMYGIEKLHEETES